MSTELNAMMQAMDQMRDYAAMVTGMKQQFIDNGWSEDSAEKLVIHALSKMS